MGCRVARAVALVGVVLGWCAGVAAAPSAIEFNPRGVVKGVRQATARFSEPMVRLGDPRPARDPFEINCTEPGTSRWLDSRTWAYDFARELPAGIQCSFNLRADVQTLAGAPIATTQVFMFSTGVPAIARSMPFEGAKDVAEDQAFILVLDAEPDPASVLAHVSFAVDGIGERIGVRVIEGAERDAILEEYRWIAKPPVVIVQATRRFPNGARVALVWGTGVATANGIATAADQRIEFQVRPPFTATFRCERVRRDAGCVPVSPMRVELSTPIAAAESARIKLLDASGAERPRARTPDDDELVSSVAFSGPFPETATFTVVVPPDLRDESGRHPENAARFPLTVQTAQSPPLAKFAARFGIIEAHADPTLPVTLRNLEPQARARVADLDVKGTVHRVPADRPDAILPWLRRVGYARRERSVFGTADPAARAGSPSPSPAPSPPDVRTMTLPKPGGERAFEVVGIPLGAPGLYVVELESARLGAALLAKPAPMYVPTVAIVTNLAVHLKWGEQGALAWVTTLDTAEPVANADVTVRDCREQVVWRGATDGQGIARIAGLPTAEAVAKCYGRDGAPERDPFDGSQTRALDDLLDGLLVVARSGDDVSFVHSSWNEGIESWRYDLPEVDTVGRTVAHTITDRPLFRAGETVHMKHVLRAQTIDGFAVPPAERRPVTLSIRHTGSDEHYEQPLAWDDAGVAESTWVIPPEAKLGSWEFHLLGAESARAAGAAREPGGEGDEESYGLAADDWLGGEVRVEEFRVPLMRGTVALPAEPQVHASAVTAHLAVQYLAGGGAANLPVTVRAQLSPKTVTAPDDFEGFTFGNGSVVEGTTRPADADAGEDERSRIHQRQQLTLDGAGTARATITDLPAADTPQELRTELEFRDPSGQAQTVSATVPLWPAARLVGIAPERWAATRERVVARIAVTDVAGAPSGGAAVTVDAFTRKSYSNRKRLVGGFYGYDQVVEVRRLGPFCTGATDPHGILWCEGPSPAEGEIVLVASTRDDAGNVAAANAEVFVAGARDLWFRQADNDRIDVLPERRRYEPGETARFQVRMPFRQATALVAVEREGIVDARVVPLAGDQPVVELAVDPKWAPNVFVSVLAVRGRVGDVEPTALVDLGKPAFKLGITEIEVGWRAHRLGVRVAAERPVYRVREHAQVKVAVRDAEGTPPPAGAEIAVAAVDEGLLELMPNRSWDLLAAMMGERAYGFDTATAQMQVVGKRHYGSKALAPGGGGGRRPTRELFDTLLLWRGRVPLDARGRATVDVPLNDSLTSFRIVAVASAGVGTFGTGAATIRATQEVMLLPGLPPVVRVGDRFRAGLTVRNTTSAERELTVTPAIDGVALAPPPQHLTLAGGEARTLEWDAVVPPGLEQVRWTFEATSADRAADRVSVTQRVRPVVPVRTLQAIVAQVGPEGVRQAVQRPSDALAGRGEVRVALAPSLAAGLDGVRDWMRGYPYGCLEQRVSRAVALRDPTAWKEIAAALPAYADEHGLLKYFPTLTAGSDVLTAYVLAVTHAADLEVPERVREGMESGLKEFLAGTLTPDAPLVTSDLVMRKLAAMEALSRRGGFEPAILATITIEPTLWPTSAVLDWWNVLQRTQDAPDRARRLAEVERVLRARLDWSGTTVGFATDSRDDLWWLMTNADANAVRLVLTAIEHGVWRDDVPRLVRGALARQRRGAWSTTVANAWGVLALEKFAEAFEREPVTGTTTVELADASTAFSWSAEPAGRVVDVAWPATGTGELAVTHTGDGAPWAAIQLRAAVPLRAPLASGYRITKTVTPLESRTAGITSRGDVVRVRLEIEAEREMTWVVVDDPVSAGASHLATGLGSGSVLDPAAATDTAGPQPAFAERGFEAFRAYYELVPAGRLVVEYAIRLDQAGTFGLPPTRVEALYAPEMFGELPNASLEVAP